MESCKCRDLASAHGSKRLQIPLDKSAAVGIDLEPACAASTVRAPVVVSLEVIAGACDILRSAVVDVRSIIHQNDGYGESMALTALANQSPRLPYKGRSIDNERNPSGASQVRKHRA